MTVQSDNSSLSGLTKADTSQEDIDLAKGASVNKEQEPNAGARDPGESILEVKSREEASDRQAAEALKGALNEAKRAAPEPELPPDVEDAGVKSPQKEADDVIARGSTLVLGVSEEGYEKGRRTKVRGTVVRGAIVGVSSISALAIWVGRMIRVAHRHTKKIVFRKPFSAKASEGEGGRNAG